MVEDTTRVKHTLTADSQKAARITANMWMENGHMVEIRPPEAISSDDYYIKILEWGE